MDFDRENNADAIVAAVRTSIQKLSGQGNQDCRNTHLLILFHDEIE